MDLRRLLMMATEQRLISLNDLMKFPIRINHYDKEHGNEHFVLGIESVLEYAEQLPTVDAAPVVNGNWVYYSTTMQECSNCKRHTARHKFKYCPHCGAVMGDKLHYAID